MKTSILLFTRDYPQARKEIEAYGGRVTQRFTDAVFAASIPSSGIPEEYRFSTAVPPTGLDDLSRRMVRAWELLRAAEPRIEEEPTIWDAPGYEHPRNPSNETKLAVDSEYHIACRTPVDESPGTVTSEYMIGSIAVGLVIVAGEREDLSFSDNEIDFTVAEVQQALEAMATAEETANLSFEWDKHLHITVDATPCSNPGKKENWEGCEAPWRDPAMEQLGYAKGMSGVRTYAEALRAEKDTDWAFVAFITKYPLAWHGYASGPRLCIEYSNDGWTRFKLNRTFAHELAHLFGAADEYGDCKCDPSGYNEVPNNNCKQCVTIQEWCLMQSTGMRLCNWTRGQLGWNYWTQVGEATWNGTRGMAEIDGKFYVVATAKANDYLYEIDPSTGDYSQVGDAKWNGTLALTSHDGKLFLIARSTFNHYLYQVDPSTGTYSQVGTASWNGACGLVSHGDKLYATARATANHYLYRIDPSTGAHSQVGDAKWKGTLGMTVHGGKLYIVARAAVNHFLYQVDPSDGVYCQVGDGKWNGTLAMCSQGDELRIVARSVTNHYLYSVNPANGYYALVGGSKWDGTCAMIALDEDVYVIASSVANRYLYRLRPNAPALELDVEITPTARQADMRKPKSRKRSAAATKGQTTGGAN